MKIFLDDVRTPPEGYVLCTTTEEVIAHLMFTQEPIEEISLDHDLGEGRHTGYELVCWIEARVARRDYPFGGERSLPVLWIHSANPVGRANMVRGIDSIDRIAARRTAEDPSDQILAGCWQSVRPLDFADDTEVVA